MDTPRPSLSEPAFPWPTPADGVPEDDADCVVIGAGVVGLAVARRMATAGRAVLILEATEAFGTGTSSRNSEVLHAGLYYAPGSLKARLCVAGVAQLYDYLQAHGLPHLRCEKLIVGADDGERAALEAIQARALAAGVSLPLLPGPEARAMEPALAAAWALHSPNTGILDSHAYMLSLLGEAEANGAMLVCHAPVRTARADTSAGRLRLLVGGEAPMILNARTVINCAGHGAWLLARDLVASLAATSPATAATPAPVPPQHWCKGNYFSLSGKAPFERLIYPVPNEAGLGLHFTRDVAGRGRFGPDTEWIEPTGDDPTVFDYRVDPGRLPPFFEAIRRYWPELDETRLAPDYSGVRPKIQAPGEPAADFVIQGPAETGIPGWTTLFGMESPGLTASLAIADLVAEITP